MDSEKKKEIADVRNYYVVKANELIQQSRFSLSMQEQKIILYLITKIKPDDKEFHLYEFNIQEFCEVCGINSYNGKNYVNLKQTIKTLANKSNWVMINRFGEECETLLRWIEKAYISHKSGTIKIRLDDDMKPFLLELKSHFTTYNLCYTLTMKSKYSIRIYELLKSYEYKKECVFEIEELKKILGAENYNSYKDFRVNVINVAINEINEISDIYVTYSAEKNGRKYARIQFDISAKTDTLERVAAYKKIHERLNPNKNNKEG